MTPAEALTGRIGGRWYGSYGTARCPVHDDRDPSLSIRDGERSVLVECHAGCDPRDIVAALQRDRRWSDMHDPLRKKGKPKQTAEDTAETTGPRLASRVGLTMPRAGAGHIYDRRAGPATQLETLRDEVRQGQQAIIERLARIEVRLDGRKDFKPKNSGGAPEKFDWFSLAIEVLRLEFDGEILSREQLRRHMEDWIATNWPDGGPSERILRARLAIICKVLNLA